MSNLCEIQPTYWRFKVALLFVIFLADVAIHSSLEYDEFGDGTEYLQALFSVVQILIQVAVFIVTFSIMSETYPFQTGLLGFIKDDFITVILIVPLYATFTSCLAGYRVSKLKSGTLLGDIWVSKTYTAFSYLNKIMCPVCHAFSIISAVKLTDPDYYSEDGWKKKRFSTNDARGDDQPNDD